MIIYFSGTGNSEYVAKRISNEIRDESVNLFSKLRNKDYSGLYSEQPWVVVCPTYAWRMPRILEEWMKNIKLKGNDNIYFVMTCGDSIGNAGKYLKILCSELKMNYLGCYEIVMPENYIAMFKTPSKEESISILDKAEPQIDIMIEYIKSKKQFPEHKINLGSKICSSTVNHIFYPIFVHAKKFHLTDGCISCELCEKVCPLNNIQISDGKPVWGNECTHCMACISKCPKNAIEYGKHSKGLPRYTCPK